MPEENRGPWSKKFENRWCRPYIIIIINRFVSRHKVVTSEALEMHSVAYSL